MKNTLALVMAVLVWTSSSFGQVFELKLEDSQGGLYTLNDTISRMEIVPGTPPNELQFITMGTLQLKFSSAFSGPTLQKDVMYEGVLSGGDPGWWTPYIQLNEPWDFMVSKFAGQPVTFWFDELSLDDVHTSIVVAEFFAIKSETEWLRGNLQYGVSAVPEPETYALGVGIGLIAFGVVRRRFKK